MQSVADSMKLVDEAFESDIDRALEKVTIPSTYTKRDDNDPDFKTSLDSFNSFKGFFHSRDKASIGSEILRILNKRWKDENFRFDIENSSVMIEKGEFDLNYVGHTHNLRFRAWSEQGGRLFFLVGVYLYKIQQKSTSWKCCIC